MKPIKNGRPAWQRGLAALLIFVLTFLVTMLIGIVIGFMVDDDILGFDVFPWAPPYFWTITVISLTLAAFLGWKSWTRR